MHVCIEKPVQKYGIMRLTHRKLSWLAKVSDDTSGCIFVRELSS